MKIWENTHFSFLRIVEIKTYRTKKEKIYLASNVIIVSEVKELIMNDYIFNSLFPKWLYNGTKNLNF